jgi:hypothetical protein
MKKAIAMMMLLGGGLFAAPAVRFGIGFGASAPIAVMRSVCPGPGYAWVNGYWVPPAAVVRVGPRFDRARGFDGRFQHFRR